ncbi:GatB/YqeY domain-containing protein [Saccharomonospora xinjiangensis]|uniref:GatB/YqeY domain-containing protein n=1 Tax=Saccharomonospora xinjiangensis TaxID=75294 RepID=UPI0035102BAF
MRAALRQHLTTALKARDRVALAALRSALGAIDNAEAVPIDSAPIDSAPIDSAPVAGLGGEHVAGAASGVGATEMTRRELTDAQLREIVENEIRERTAAADEYERLGRADHAERLRAEAEVLTRHLVR